MEIPKGYDLKTVRSEKQDNIDVWVFRYEKSSGENNGIGGEHFSFVINKKNHKILGVTWMDKRFTEGQLPNKEQTGEIARDFLNKVEPGLFDRLKNLWIDQHDETITVKNGETSESATVSGMKYKCYLKDEDNYAWVIVGPG